MDFCKKSSVRTSLAGAALLLMNSSHFSASAQGNASGVVLPGDVPIAGASTRGFPQPEVGIPAPNAAIVQEMIARRTQLQQRLQGVDVPSSPPLMEAIVPGLTANTPVAYGGFKGLGAVGFAYQDRVRYANNNDAVAGLVMSFGSPQTVGVDLALNILDLSNNGGTGGGGFGRRTSLSFKIHRPLNNNWAVAFGADDAIGINKTSDQRRSFYGVVTKQIDLKKDARQSFSRLHLSLGLGNGRFQSEQDVFAGDNGVGIFGSAALQASRYVRPFAEWTGQDLNLGVSLVPFKRLPLVITPTFVDVANRAGDGTRFTIGAAYRFGY